MDGLDDSLFVEKLASSREKDVGRDNLAYRHESSHRQRDRSNRYRDDDLRNHSSSSRKHDGYVRDRIESRSARRRSRFRSHSRSRSRTHQGGYRLDRHDQRTHRSNDDGRRDRNRRHRDDRDATEDRQARRQQPSRDDDTQRRRSTQSQSQSQSPRPPTMKPVESQTMAESKQEADESSDDEIGPSLPVQDSRLAYEDDQEARTLRHAQNKLGDKIEARRRADVEEELNPRPDPGHAARQAARVARKIEQNQDDRDGVVETNVFEDDEIKARMKRDAERREERERIRKLKDLERDQERQGRMSALRAKEEGNMAILKELARKRFG